jgi:hypothetical protein
MISNKFSLQMTAVSDIPVFSSERALQIDKTATDNNKNLVI